MLDVDLRFRIDVGELFALYDKFEDSEYDYEAYSTNS